MKKYIVFSWILFLTVSLVAMEDSSAQVEPQSRVYAIPGQNGSGCEFEHVSEMFGDDGYVDVSTPLLTADLGQNRCLKFLREALDRHPNDKNIIAYAVSQGTATVLNHLAETKDQRIKCVVLQAPLVSGNSAILHTLGGPLMNFPRLAKLPFAHYWIPYLAKILFPFYWPAGKQPIKSIQKIDRRVPIVIVHAKDDPQLPYAGACALYYGLRSQGRDNVYFMGKDGNRHMWLLNEHDKPAIDAILARHGLRQQTAQLAAVDLSRYQPDHMQFKADYDDLIAKEKKHTLLKYAGAATVAFAGAYVFRHKIRQVMHRIVPPLNMAWNKIRSSMSAFGRFRGNSFTPKASL